jgi:hypothetical protein
LANPLNDYNVGISVGESDVRVVDENDEMEPELEERRPSMHLNLKERQ